ncbi:MAG: carboxypeptidase regulatory-like domain-containing protein [Bryobacteraceae bacterium]|nr:carboxypeptidase regulatory-like domain-containing protein [Bryobacteraceae bacterium]
MCIVFAVALLPAQNSAGNGAVTGVVQDASGAVVPGAKVIVANAGKGIRRELESNGSGLFSAPALVPSAGYSLTVTKQGFATYNVSDFQVTVGANVDFKIMMQVASSATQVEVTAAAPVIEETKSGVTDVVNQGQIDGLPINGRRADTFALLTPAVAPDGTFGLISFRGISSGNAFLTDGNYTTNSFYMENAGRTRISTQISQDAVQEFQVLSDGYSAEFGRAMGGIINTVTRSGSNAYHGTGYEFFRNRSLNAPDRYAPFSLRNPPEWRHQAGGSLGGPIKKDKLFFFSNFELVKRNFPGFNRITTSQIADPSGSVVNPANCTVGAKGATQAQCTAAIAFIQKQMDVLVPRTVDSYMGFAKLDYRPNDRNTFSFDANAMHWRSPYGIQTQAVLTNGNMIGGNGNSTVETRYGKADWTWITSPSSLNDLRFGWFKDRLSDPASSDLWPSTGPVVISVAGAAVGAAAAYPRTFPSEQRFQISDNFSLTKGAHSFKFGVDFSTTEDYMNQLYNGAGTYSYSTLTAFAMDFTGNTSGLRDYSSFSQTFGNPIQDIRTTEVNLFAQDTWKLSRRATLSYGVRWEKAVLPQPTMTDPNYAQTGKIPGTNKDFAPRVSLAYSLDDKTVLRVGGGMFYAPYVGNGLDTLFLGNGLYQTSITANPTTTGAPVFPNPVATVSAVPAGTKNLTFADKNFYNPYTEQATLAIQRQVGRDMDVTASYIFSHGVGLITSRDVNLGAPTTTQTYTIQDANKVNVGTFTTPIWTSASKVDARYGRLYQVENGGNSSYNALALQFRKRMSHGLTLQASYTWSHAIDDAQQSGASTTIGYAQSNLLSGDYSADKGSSATDQRHRATINWLWAPKLTKSDSWAARYLINGWELSSITTMASSQPTTAYASVSGTQFTGVSFYATSTLNGSGGWGRVPFWPVNSLNIDKMYRVDARLTRNLPFTEKVNGMLIFEAFNAFNTQYNTGVNTTAYTATKGVLVPVAGLGVGNQSQGFPDGTNARRAQVAFRLVF